jgi:hypothetical protein
MIRSQITSQIFVNTVINVARSTSYMKSMELSLQMRP